MPLSSTASINALIPVYGPADDSPPPSEMMSRRSGSSPLEPPFVPQIARRCICSSHPVLWMGATIGQNPVCEQAPACNNLNGKASSVRDAGRTASLPAWRPCHSARADARVERMAELSLYVHIPYCQSKCPYCDFNSYAARHWPEARYVSALCKEMEAYGRQAPWRGAQLRTVFFGGGTPSLFAPASIAAVLRTALRLWPALPAAEVTLEANPGTVTADKLD